MHFIEAKEGLHIGLKNETKEEHRPAWRTSSIMIGMKRQCVPVTASGVATHRGPQTTLCEEQWKDLFCQSVMLLTVCNCCSDIASHVLRRSRSRGLTGLASFIYFRTDGLPY